MAFRQNETLEYEACHRGETLNHETRHSDYKIHWALELALILCRDHPARTLLDVSTFIIARRRRSISQRN